MNRILLVDDEQNLRGMLAGLLAGHGFHVSEAGSVSGALALLQESRFDAMVADFRLGDGDGKALMAAAHDIDDTLPVIMLTAYATADLAVSSMAAGAFDFITKPFIPDIVVAAVNRACSHSRLARENTRLRVRGRRAGAIQQIIGEATNMAEVKRMIGRVGPTSARVLILGETGTGKELVARALHEASPRRDGPYVAVNCASLAESLLESELFGHAKGAFTGADTNYAGMFEQADGGTLLLDEAGEMSLSLQAKLLRVLEDGVVRRVGGGQRKVDVRVIAATHRALNQLVEAGKFRADLFQRLSVFPLALPPLRERASDLPLLVQHFLLNVALDLRMRPVSIRPAALEKLSKYPFPGNIRELRNLIERAYILAAGSDLDAKHFPLEAGATGQSPAPSALSAPAKSDGSDLLTQLEPRTCLAAWVSSLPETVDLRAAIESAERAIVQRALDASKGNQTKAAQNLNISRPDLAYKLKKWTE